MSLPIKSRGFLVATATALSLALLVPANAQFWDWGGRGGGGGDWGGWGRQRQQQRDQYWSPFESRPQRDRYEQREAPIDYSRAPAPTQKKPEATTNVVVLGDGMADWLALGLEEAFAEKPEIGVARKHRTDSGLIRYDHRRDVEWAQVVKEVIAAEKPKFIVMMVGNNDRQSIRERAPVAVRPGTQKPAAQTAQQQTPPPPAAGAATPPPAAQPDPEQQIPEGTPEPQPAPTPEQIRAGALGPWEFHSEKWEAAYIRRIDATIAALKSAGVPVIWVGLPSQRGTKATSDSSYLNELFRARAEKAAITYVDIWDGFVDESGRYAPQGPDFEGQTRRLRSGDGIYFTKFGARKLAHYVEREIQRNITNRAVPVALPAPVEPGTPAGAGPAGAGAAKPSGPAQRPAVGPVVPLTASATTTSDELMGGGGRAAAKPATPDPAAVRVLTKGEPIAPPSGRADDFSWPRGNAPIEPVALQPTPASPMSPAGSSPANAAAQSKTGQQAGQQGGEAKPQQPRRRAPDAPRAQGPFQGFGFFRW